MPRLNDPALKERLRRLGFVAIVMSIVALLQFAWVVPLGSTPLSPTLLLLGIFTCATYGGLWSGLGATAISVIVAVLYWRGAALPSDEAVRIALLGTAGVLAALMAQAARNARLRADADRVAVRRQMQERATAELRLASSEQRFRTVVDALPDAVFMAEADGRLRLLNRSWLDTSPRAPPTQPQDLFALVHPDDDARARATWADTVAAGAPLEVRCRLRARDQTYRWVLVRAQVIAAPRAEEEQWCGVILDIDKALLAERALRDSSERLRLALEATELGLWDFDFTTDSAVCSDRVYAIAGLEKKSISRAVWVALVVPEDLQALVDHARAAITPPAPRLQADGSVQPGTLDIEYRIRRASDGAVRWVALTGRVAFDPARSATPIRAIGTLRDVTRQREAVERLRQSEERLALAQEAGRIGMFDWDLASNRFACSSTEEALLGFAPGQFGGTYAALRALVHPADREPVEVATRQALERSDAYAGEFRIVRPDTAVRWLAAQATIARSASGTPLRMVGVHRDVTDEKEAARRLEASEERFRLATEALDGLIYDYDPIEDHVARSRGLYAITGFHVEEVPATGGWWRSRIHPQDLERTSAAFEKAVGENALRIEQEYRVRHRDRHWVHVNDRALLVWRRGVVCRVVGVAIDVTERRRIERVLHDADRRKDEFLAVLAHELRNPLAPIRNAVQVIARVPEPTVVAGAAAILERQVSQMVRLIDDLLDVSRIAQGKLKLQRRSTALATVIETAVETVQPLLRAKNQVFEQSGPAPDVMIEADGVRLSQVIANLLHNAVKYTAPGGHITLAAEVDASARTIEIRVTDTGIGISGHALESIFTMFSQLPDSPEAGRHDGLGIGLALARAIVTLHGGTIYALSEGPERGSQFVLQLPLSEASVEQREVPAAGSEPPHWRVLVVDDNRDSAESLAAVLRLDQHEVLVAYGGREALLVAEREHPDLILLDIGMPDVDGYEVARLLRAGDQVANARIVAVSGYGQAGDREKSMAAGCDGHLVKPVAASDLAPWLKREPALETLHEPGRSEREYSLLAHTNTPGSQSAGTP